jgi:hypothetical protein
MTTPSYNRDPLLQRLSLHRNIGEASPEQMAKRQQISSATSLFNDKCYHLHRLRYKMSVLKGTPTCAAWDEGSKKRQIAVVGHIVCTFQGEKLQQWQEHFETIKQHTKPVAHLKKRGRAQKKDGAATPVPSALSVCDFNRPVQRFRALMPTKYAKDKSGFGIGDLVLEGLSEVGLDCTNPTLYIVVVDGASTNTGRRLGSVERIRQRLDHPLLSMLRCHASPCAGMWFKENDSDCWAGE